MVKFIIFMLLIAASAFAQDYEYGILKTFNKGEIYYEKGIKEEVINKLGNYFVQDGFFDGSLRSIQVLDDGLSYVIKLIVSDSLLTEKEYIKQLGYYTYLLSSNVFNGRPVDVHLSSSYFVSKKVVKFHSLGTKLENENDIIYYLPDISKETANSFMKFLKDTQFFTGDGKVVMIRTTEGVFNMLYPIEEGYDKDAEYQQIVSEFATHISQEFLNGNKIIIYLTDSYFEELKAISNF
ncbi:MAG TPA: hypothetical protein PLE30_07475 [Candidatus Kapabacteria bacterium]|nr:hypothetical protein [Candidatus Kapabacteria bacterium]